MMIDADEKIKISNSLYSSADHNVLVDLLTTVKSQGYKFTTVTPRTHDHFLSKEENAQGSNVQDIFGWNLPFSVDAICPMLKQLMFHANIIEPRDGLKQSDGLARSRLRISSLGPDLFFHSAYPTVEPNAVFFGPDTYRFARFIQSSLAKDNRALLSASEQHKKPLRILDIGCGTGAGGIVTVRALPPRRLYELTMNDINADALDLTRVNAQVADVPIHCMQGDIFETLNEKFDLIIANPPYMKDDSGRAYRDGGENLGLSLSVRIFKTAFEHLSPGGTLLLYTGVAMTSQSDPFLSIIAPLLTNENCTWSYEEIDPDVFGEELELPAYSTAHRIAAVGLTVTRN